MPDTLPPIRHPARFVPLAGIATGEPGDPALAVSPANPVPSREQPLRGARVLLPDTVTSAGTALLIDCSAEGKAGFVLSDGSSLTLTIAPGLTLLPFAVTQLTSVGMTAVLDAWVLD